MVIRANIPSCSRWSGLSTSAQTGNTRILNNLRDGIAARDVPVDQLRDDLRADKAIVD